MKPESRRSEVAAALLLTPPGRGAVATISVTGTAALDCVSHCFIPARSRALRDAPLSDILYGRWGGDRGEEVVVCRVTEVDLELHCHGGYAAAQRILTDLAAHGASVRGWQDVLVQEHRACIRAAALDALTQCATPRTAAILWDQYRGALAQALRELRALIRAGREEEALSAIDGLLARAALGLHLTEPWRVALVGEPNVGKSSLLNALLGYNRAIVHHQPGTTRDLVTGLTAFDGWPSLLVDTAGLRESTEPVEQAGVQLAMNELRRADLMLWVRDATRPRSAESERLNVDRARTLIVWNKCDLLTNAPEHIAAGARVSATTGQGIESLSQAIAARLVPNPPARPAAVPITRAQVARLEDLRQQLRDGRAEAASAALDSWLTSRQHAPLPGEIRE
jgi:tRNA modification GTPase